MRTPCTLPLDPPLVLLLNSRHKNFGHLNNMCHIQCLDLCHEKLRDLPHSVYVLCPFSTSDKKTTQVMSNTAYTFEVVFKLLNSLCYTISKKKGHIVLNHYRLEFMLVIFRSKKGNCIIFTQKIYFGYLNAYH